MRLNEILIENTQLDEAPKGFLSRAKDAVLSKVPGSIGAKAQGRREVGDEANTAKKEFMIFLGKVGKKPTPQTVIDFLRKNGYPTGGAEQEMTKITTGQKVGQAVGKGAAAVGKGVAAVAGGIAKGVGSVAKGVSDVAKGAVAGAKAANAPTAEPASQEKPAEPAAEPAQGTTLDTDTLKKSNDPVKIAAAKKKIPQPSAPKQAVNQSIDWSEANWIFEDADAVLSSGQLDAIFLRAVQDAVARDEGGATDVAGTGVAPADAQSGGLGGFAKGVAKGAADPKKAVPEEIKAQIEKLNLRQKQQLVKML